MGAQGDTTRTQESGEATRERIVQAARELVVERGYADVSTSEVLKRAGVSRGGLYHHFAGKEQLMAAVLDALERDFVERLGAAVAVAPDPFSALRDGVQWYLDECMH
jgi:AcrR family transcriptional regulator